MDAGKRWAELRAQLGLSREKFAKQAGITPGAMWRIEAKGTFKSGELDKLRTAFPDGEVSGAVAVAEPLAQPTLPATVTVNVPVPTVSVTDELDDVAPVVVDLPTAPIPSEPAILNTPELTPYQLFEQDGVRRYSNSEIQAFKRCRRKWYLGFYRRYQPKHQSPVGARAIGDRLHRALRWHYHGDPTQRVNASDALEYIIKIDHAVLVKHYAPELIPLALETKFTQEADLERVMITGYLEWLSETGADSEYQFIGSEKYVEVSEFLEDKSPIKLIARLDAHVRRISDGALMFIDHKSVGNFEGPMRVLNLNEQMLFYLIIERISNPDSLVDGAIFNMMRRCKRTPTAKPPFYKRVEVRHNIHTRQNFTTRTLGTIAEIERVRRLLDEGADHRVIAFPTPTQDCTWSCDFLPLESLIDDGSAWEAMANAFYMIGDPSHYYVKGNEQPSV